MLLGLERGGRKGVGKGQWWVLIKTNVCGWSYWSIGGGSLRLVPALQDIAKY